MPEPIPSTEQQLEAPTPGSGQPAAGGPEPPPAPVPTLRDQYDFEDDGDEFPAAAVAPGAAPATPPTATPKPKHSARIVRMATELGVAQEDIDDSTPAELERIVAYTQRLALREARTQQREQAVAPGGSASPAGPAQQPAPAAPPRIDLGIKEEDYDPGLVAAIRKIESAYDVRIKALEDKIEAHSRAVQTISQREQAREAETVAERIDRAFAGLAAYKDVLGSGSARQMAADSAEYSRRMAVLGEAERIAGPQATVEAKIAMIERAAKTILGDRTRPPAPAAPAAPLTPEQQAWQDAQVNRPTQRAARERPNGKAKAVDAVRKLQAEFGTAEEPTDLKEDFL